MDLFMIQAKELAIIGSRHEILSRPVACSEIIYLSNFKTSVAEVCCKLKVVETGFMYESKLVFPLGSVEARFGPTDVKWSFKISHISAGFVKELSPLFSSLIEELLVHLRYVNSLIVLHISFGLPTFCSTSDL